MCIIKIIPKRAHPLVLLLSLSFIQHVQAADNPLKPNNSSAQIKSEEIFVDLWINDIDQHKDVLLIKKDQKSYIECDPLHAALINIQLLSQISEQGLLYCVVSQPDIKLNLDNDAQALKLSFPIRYLGQQSLGNSFNPDRPTPSDFGGFLNYSLLYDQNYGTRNFNGLWQLGFFQGNMLFNSSYLSKLESGGNDNQDSSSIRLDTTLTLDQSDHLTSLQIGDAFSTGNALTPAFRFGGIRWGTNYSARPDFVYWNVPSVRGTALVPSLVNLYINGMSVYKNNVNPGVFNVNSGAYINGSGNAQLVVQDVLGNETVQNLQVYVTKSLLKEGLDDYNVSFGRLRYNYDIYSNDYRDYFGSASFRRGLTSGISLGAHAEYSDSIQDMGMDWTQQVDYLGVLDISSTMSHSDDKNGQAASFGLTRDIGKFNLGITTNFYSPTFTSLGYGEGNSAPKRQSVMFVGLQDIPYLGNLTLNYIEQINYPYRSSNNNASTNDNLFFDNNISLPNSRIFELRSMHKLTPNLYMSAGISRDVLQESRPSYLLSLTYQFDQKHSAYYNQSGRENASFNLVKADSQAVGVDYAATVGRIDQTNSYGLSTTLKTTMGDVTLEHDHSSNGNNSQVSYQGAMIWLADHLEFTKNVNDAFSLVRLPGYPNIDIYRNSLFIGKTDKDGKLFVNGMTPYTQQTISFSSDQLPMDDTFTTSNKVIIPLSQHGYIIGFPVQHSINMTFELKDNNGQLLPVGSQVYVDNAQDNLYPLDNNHRVTIFGLAVGVHKLHVKTGVDRFCSANYKVSTLKVAALQSKPVDIVCN